MKQTYSDRKGLSKVLVKRDGILVEIQILGKPIDKGVELAVLQHTEFL